MFPGRSASPGIAIGKAVIVQHSQPEIVLKAVMAPQEELSRLNQAAERARAELQKIHQHAFKTLGPEEAAIFEAHLMILDDPELLDQVRAKISSEKLNAEYAFQTVVAQFVSLFENMDNEYMRARAADIKDIGRRILGHLTGSAAVDLSSFDENVIILADDLTPSEFATMDLKHVAGFVTETGGRTSHVAIMTRTLEIPAVVGAKEITSRIGNGELVVFDGDVGEVFTKPDSKTLERFQELKAEQDALRRELGSMIGKDAVTLDGRKVTLAANIGTPKDIEVLKRNDAQGVGLFRTEFLFMNRNNLPPEEEQFQAYKEVLEACKPSLTIIRTLDIGGDKKLPYFEMEHEENPFLGNRAIRLCLQNKPVFKTQLRALLRASTYGHLGIMFPMISCLEELQEAKAVLEEVRAELRAERVPVAGDIQVGIMIEIPSAAMIADVLAKHCDFFSIGTNDLIQYTCAVDRMNKNLEALYSPYHPGVLRLIQNVIQCGHKEGIWVGVCGEVGGKPELVPLLLGMGLDEFSMSPPSILPIRKLIRAMKYTDAQRFVSEVLALPTSSAIEKRMMEIAAGYAAPIGE